MQSSASYAIVSPVKNEARNIRHTIRSVLAQTVMPMVWVIVDDGSTDGTVEIVETLCREHAWISLLQHRIAGRYNLSGGSEIQAFYRGYEAIRHLGFQFLSKLDGDISFGQGYFGDLLKQFLADERLGIASGAVYDTDAAGAMESTYELHVRGAARVYRRQCWDEMGGTYDQLGWDALDVYRARMLGWETRSFPGIPMVHHVKTWTKGGLLRGMARSGRIYYVIGAHPIFVMAKAVAALFRWPCVVRGLALAYGYLAPAVRGAARLGDDAVRSFVRREQIARMKAAIPLFRRGLGNHR